MNALLDFISIAVFVGAALPVTALGKQTAGGGGGLLTALSLDAVCNGVSTAIVSSDTCARSA